MRHGPDHVIRLLDIATSTGEVAVTMRRDDGAVGYLKDEALQTLIDARGRNLAPHVDDAVEILGRKAPGSILVLGFGGGAASTMLHRAGARVVSVDLDPCAKPIAELFFRAPPCLDVVVEDAEAYVQGAPEASFDGAFVDFQDSPTTPAAYLRSSFWSALAEVLKPGGVVVVNLTEWLYGGGDWRAFQLALMGGGLDAVALGDEHGAGNRILVSSPLAQPAPEDQAS